MSRALQFALFFSTFVLLFGLMNYYVIGKIFSIFTIKKGILFFLILAFAVFSYMIANYLEASFPGNIARTLYYIAAIWMGVALIGCMVFGISDFLGLFNLRINGIILIILVVIISSFAALNAQFLNTRQETIYSDKVDKEIRIVHLTDIHIGPIRQDGWLTRIVTLTNSLKPDYVIITGDLFDGMKDYKKEEFEPFNKVKVPIYYSIGNHEIYAQPERVLPLLNHTKIKILRNEFASTKDFQIIGIDDAESKSQVKKELSKMDFDDSKFTILSYHRPDGWNDSRKKGIDLQLSGHTHNGQIFPFNFLVYLFHRPVHGLHEKDGKYIFVGYGTGTWGPPMRLYSRNEVVLIRILPKS